jgi:uncharacterized protein YlxW (UPF0749 family)
LKKVKYFYNTHTLRYEKLVTPLRVKLLRVFGFIATALTTSFIIVLIGQKYFPSANERSLLQENANLRSSLRLLDQQLEELEQRMAAVEKRRPRTRQRPGQTDGGNSRVEKSAQHGAG